MTETEGGSPNERGVPEVIASRYEVDVEIGSGAFATTWRGLDRRLGRQVAIKILSRAYARDPIYIQRFEREAQTAASLSNGNVVDIYDFGQQGDLLYIVMQYIAGEDLKHLIVREGSLPPERAREIVIQVLTGIAAIHATGIVHRDIKPQNILIGTDGQVRVADFGIAQVETDGGLTTAGTTIGTAAYMAPEQAEGGRTTAATDIYAMGVVLFELLTGSLPFAAPNPMALMLAHIQQQPVAPSQRATRWPIPSDLDGIVLQAMSKNPGDRFRSASAMIQALRNASMRGGGTQATTIVGTAKETPRTTRSAGPVPRSGGNQRHVAVPPTSGGYHDLADGTREGGGLRGVLGGFLILLLIAVIAGAGYLWWDAREEVPAGVDATRTPIVQATETIQNPTALSTDEPIQVIEPSRTVPPTLAPQPTGTLVPTPTLEPTAEIGPTIAPANGGDLPATLPTEESPQPGLIEPMPTETAP